MEEIKLMIAFIEEEYPRDERNTPDKMRLLIKKEFDIDIAPQSILNICGLEEDYETESRRIENM